MILQGHRQSLQMEALGANWVRAFIYVQPRATSSLYSFQVTTVGCLAPHKLLSLSPPTSCLVLLYTVSTFFTPYLESSFPEENKLMAQSLFYGRRANGCTTQWSRECAKSSPFSILQSEFWGIWLLAPQDLAMAGQSLA